MNSIFSNQLFLVCPFCQMEGFIRKHFGNVFFLTSPASVFDFEDDAYLKEVKKTIYNENIQDIYLVGDVSCQFVRNALISRELGFCACEQFIGELRSETDTPVSLTEKLLKKQLYELSAERIFGSELEKGELQLHALMTSKAENLISPVYCEFLQRMQLGIEKKANGTRLEHVPSLELIL
ncbi:hypothetical protein [Runella sp. SP2]|uniref:hypothetical protein n=1 Tax=Runella sp. SP2 TaxID=2268026 RepID=UPI0013DDF4D3|nr:hypothetical protein [Runella sp. SP2]